jgi:CBS domain-containing protein
MFVRDVMSPTPKTLGRNDHLVVADDLMKAERIRHLPVLDEQGRLAGIVTQRDLFHSALVRALGFGTTVRDKMLDSILVKEVMNEEVVTTTAATPSQRKIGCLPVVDGDTLVGILTEGDLVALVAASVD